jgi:hypothetical protein
MSGQMNATSVSPEVHHPTRQYPRVKCSARATAGLATGEVQCFSKSGLFLATDAVMPPGSEVELQFYLPDGTYLSAVGEVRRVMPEEGFASAGLGIKFLRINSEALSAIEKLAALDPLVVA